MTPAETPGESSAKTAVTHAPPAPAAATAPTWDAHHGSGPKLFIIAGDPSGDIHAGNMARALLKRCPTARIAGLGGPNLEKAGVKVLTNLVEDLAIIGVTGVVRHFPEIRRLFLHTVEFLDRSRTVGVTGPR